MHRLSVLLCALALALPSANAFAALKKSAATERAEVRVTKVIKVVGPAKDAERWGPVKVTVLIKRVKDNGKIVSQRITKIVCSYPDELPRSDQINSDAVPYLISYAMQNQTWDIDIVTGASMTSEAFRESLQVALKRVGFVKV